MTVRSGIACLLRVFIGEDDTFNGRPLYEELVRLLRERGLAGATVLKGIEGYGAHSRVHTARILRLSQDLPIVVEVIDAEDKVRGLLPEVEAMIPEGLITLERVEAISLTREKGGPPGDETSPRGGGGTT